MIKMTNLLKPCVLNQCWASTSIYHISHQQVVVLLLQHTDIGIRRWRLGLMDDHELFFRIEDWEFLLETMIKMTDLLKPCVLHQCWSSTSIYHMYHQQVVVLMLQHTDIGIRRWGLGLMDIMITSFSSELKTENFDRTLWSRWLTCWSLVCWINAEHLPPSITFLINK